MSETKARIPLALKLIYSIYVALLVPTYWHYYGPSNFLWFSDIALLLTVPALWLESRSLASMMALAALIPDSVWIIDLVSRLLLSTHLIGGTEYMFDPTIPLYMRNLSYFHVFLPPLLLLLIIRLGYDRRALVRQAGLAWCVLLCCYFTTDRETNINWVFGIGSPQETLPSWLYLAVLMMLIPLLVYLPTHLLLKRFWGAQKSSARETPKTAR